MKVIVDPIAIQQNTWEPAQKGWTMVVALIFLDAVIFLEVRKDQYTILKQHAVLNFILKQLVSVITMWFYMELTHFITAITTFWLAKYASFMAFKTWHLL